MGGWWTSPDHAPDQPHEDLVDAQVLPKAAVVAEVDDQAAKLLEDGAWTRVALAASLRDGREGNHLAFTGSGHAREALRQARAQLRMSVTYCAGVHRRPGVEGLSGWYAA